MNFRLLCSLSAEKGMLIKMQKMVIRKSMILILLLLIVATTFYYMMNRNTMKNDSKIDADHLEIYLSDVGELNGSHGPEVCRITDTSSYTVKNTAKEEQLIKSSDFILETNGHTSQNESEYKEFILKKGEEATFDLKFEYILPLETVEFSEGQQRRTEDFKHYSISIYFMMNNEKKLEINEFADSCSNVSIISL